MGFRRGVQASDVVQLVRHLVQSAWEWQQGLVVIKLDVAAAYDSVRLPLFYEEALSWLHPDL
eukprot:7149869-Prorocentrum_lima.AAC.1